MAFSSGIGAILLYQQGSILAHIVAFLTLFGTPFFITGTKKINILDTETFIRDIFIGITALVVSGVIFLLGTYKAFAIGTSILIPIIFIIKLETGKRE